MPAGPAPTMRTSQFEDEEYVVAMIVGWCGWTLGDVVQLPTPQVYEVLGRKE